VPELDGDTRRRIDEHLPAYGTSQNPVDATAQAAAKIGYAGLAGLVVPSPAVDGIIVVMTARNPHNLERQKEALARLAAETPKPILMWSYTLPAPRSVEILSEAGYPLYTGLQTCARTMRAMADYRALRERFLRPIEVRSTFVPDRAAAGAALAAADAVLCEWEARPILARYGIGSNPVGRLASSADAAVAAAQTIGGAVALKVQSSDILHKTEAGAVALGLASAQDVRGAYARVLASARQHVPGARILGVLVQPMAPPGREVILGVKRDATFGPLLMVGLGGIEVEVLKDVALAPVPLAPGEARELLARLKGAALLEAHRGKPPADVDTLVELMVRLSHFAADHADAIAEIDLNPVLVHEQGKGASVVDALIVKAQIPRKGGGHAT
jgi:acyl-CoA synthetase (NDP forming)